MVEDGDRLVVDRAQVGVRVRPSRPGVALQEGVLPPDRVERRDLGHYHRPEEGDELVVDDVLLGPPGVLLQLRGDVVLVQLNEVEEADVERLALPGLEVPLEPVRIGLGREPALALAAGAAVGVLVAELARPCAVRLLPRCHLRQPPSVRSRSHRSTSRSPSRVWCAAPWPQALRSGA